MIFIESSCFAEDVRAFRPVLAGTRGIKPLPHRNQPGFLCSYRENFKRGGSLFAGMSIGQEAVRRIRIGAKEASYL